MSFSFESPYLLLLLGLLPLLAFLRGKTGRRAALRFPSTSLAATVASPARRTAGSFIFFLRLATLALVIIALARPRLGEGHEEVTASGIDILLAVDVSTSMTALDFATSRNPRYNRLDASKDVIRDFIDQRPSDRIGIIAFAGAPYLVSPLTLSHDFLQTNLERLQTGMIEDGTAIGSAIGMSVNRLRDIPAKSRVVILLTDGVNNAGELSPVAAAEAAAAFGTKVYTVAVGQDGQTPVPVIVQDMFGRERVVRQVMPIDEDTLRKIAEVTRAQYFKASDLDQLKEIYDRIDELEKTEVTLRQYSTFTELFFWPLGFAIGLLALEQVLANTRLRRLP